MNKTAPYPAGQPMPPPPGYAGSPPPGYAGAPATVIIQPGVGHQHFSIMGESPVQTRCPNCQQEVVTQTMHDNGNAVWISVGVLVLIGCWLGCCLIPTCIDGLKDVIHICPNCKAVVGRYKRL